MGSVICKYPNGNETMDRIHTRDEKLIKNARRFSTFRSIFLFLAISDFIGILFGIFLYNGPIKIENEIGSGIWGLIILFLISYSCHLRLQHIESIHYYRQKDARIKND